MALDPDVERMAEAVAAAMPRPLRELGVKGAREFLATMAKRSAPPPDFYSVADKAIPGVAGPIAVRIYRPGPQTGLPVLLFLHGGGWTVGDLNSRETLCRVLSERAQCIIVSVDYRLAPENKFPAAVDDSYAALEWVAANAASFGGDPTRIAIGGDSAGANLSAAICIMSRDRGGPRIIFQLLAYPATEYAVERPSWLMPPLRGQIMTVEDVVWFWDQYLRDEADRRDPRATPSNAASLVGLPAAFILTAEHDPLRDDGESYAELLRSAGVQVVSKRYPGVFHGFFHLVGVLKRTSEALDDAVGHLSRAFGPASDTPGVAPVGGLSHVSGRRDRTLLDLTIPALFARAVAAYGEQEAAVFPAQGRRFTWNELSRAVDSFAGGLLSLGVRQGDRVGIWSPNRWEWLVTQYATARIGVVLVNINPAYRVYELEYALNKVGCAVLVAADSFKTSDYIEMIRSVAPEIDTAAPGALSAARLPNLRAVIRLGDAPTPGMFSYAEIEKRGATTAKAELDEISGRLNQHDPVNIQFTSGTTGAPKGATLTHANIVNNGHFVTEALNFTASDRLCIPVPLYHCFGMVMGSLGCVSKGAAMVFPSEGFDPVATLRAVEMERCTGLYGVPTMFVAMLDHADFARFNLTSLRTGIMAGSPCPIEVMKRVVTQMNMSEVTIAYGMTETSPVSFQSGADDPLERRVATVGRIHPHLEVKIVDAKGQTTSIGESGELCTRGYSVMKGYWDDKLRTDEAIDAGGWMHTGDLAIIDADGYCNIVGRVKDMIIRGGENVYPREVEELLYRHPKVKEVQVFGVPDIRYGEEICAWIVTPAGATLTEDEVKTFCKDQISHYKVPRHIRFKTELPMTVTGKPQKFLMRDEMVKELGLSEQKTA